MAGTGSARGMTLLELLAALAVTAVLAAMAYPSYRNHVLRVHRTEAIEGLLLAAAAQENFHLRHGHYATAVWSDDPAEASSLDLPERTARGRYLLALTTTDSSFVAEARPVAGGGQEDDALCARFLLDAAGRRRAFDASGRDTTSQCWR